MSWVAFLFSAVVIVVAGRLGQALLGEEARLFALWSRVREGALSRADSQVRMLPVITRVKALLREGAEAAQAQTRRTCQNLVKLAAALWTFVWEEAVEPTNNQAERPLRRAVLRRRRSFGTQSERGSQFVERILTVVTTLRQQREVLEYLTSACTAILRAEPPPALDGVPLFCRASQRPENSRFCFPASACGPSATSLL